MIGEHAHSQNDCLGYGLEQKVYFLSQNYNYNLFYVVSMTYILQGFEAYDKLSDNHQGQLQYRIEYLCP